MIVNKGNIPPVMSYSFTRQLKFIGWSWIVLGGLWMLLLLFAVIARPPQSEDPWNETLGKIEITVFAGSLMSGIAVLRQWRWAPAAICFVSVIWFSFSLYMIWPDVRDLTPHYGILSPHLIGYGPSLFLSVYSPIIMVRSTIRKKMKQNDDLEGGLK
jgi:hypothetical protein